MLNGCNVCCTIYADALNSVENISTGVVQHRGLWDLENSYLPRLSSANIIFLIPQNSMLDSSTSTTFIIFLRLLNFIFNNLSVIKDDNSYKPY